MEENLEGIQRPVYRNLRIIWQLLLIGSVLSFFDNILVTVASIVLLIVRIVQVRALADVSDGMARAYRVLIIGLALTVGCSLLGLLSLGSILSVIFVLAALAGAIVLIVADYYFYFGLDDLAALRGYAYPRGRIKRCFWLSLIGGVVVGTAEQNGAAWFAEACNIVIMVVTLVLFWQYLEAVKQAEQNA